MTDQQVNAPDRGIRWLTAAAVLVVASIAAVASFMHIEHLAVTNGQNTLSALLLPISVDGTVAVASLAMLWAARAGGGARAETGTRDARPRGDRDPGRERRLRRSARGDRGAAIRLALVIAFAGRWRSPSAWCGVPWYPYPQP